MLLSILWTSVVAAPPTTVCYNGVSLADLSWLPTNARDFRALVGSEDIHPGLIILPCVGRERAFALLQAAIAYVEAMGDAMDAMINHVLEVDAEGAIRHYPLPV